MTLAMQIDIVLAVLLLIAIGAMAVLNKRLSSLRGDRSELEKLTQYFGEATGRADAGISSLKSVAGSLDQVVAEARGLRDDLDFLLDRGGKLADRLEGEVRRARPVEAARTAPAAESIVVKPAAARSAAHVAASGTVTANVPAAAKRPPNAASTISSARPEKAGAAPARAGDGMAPTADGSHVQPLTAAERHLVAVLQGRG